MSKCDPRNPRTLVPDKQQPVHIILGYHTQLLGNIVLFVCLGGIFVPEFSTRREIKVTMTGEGLQLLTYARHSWPLSSEGSLYGCHTYSDTGHPIKVDISEDPP